MAHDSDELEHKVYPMSSPSGGEMGQYWVGKRWAMALEKEVNRVRYVIRRAGGACKTWTVLTATNFGCA